MHFILKRPLLFRCTEYVNVMNAMEANGDNTRRLLTLLSQGHPIVMDAMKTGRFEALSMLGFSSAAAAYVKDLTSGQSATDPK
jgi:hypothetical protein